MKLQLTKFFNKGLVLKTLFLLNLLIVFFWGLVLVGCQSSSNIQVPNIKIKALNIKRPIVFAKGNDAESSYKIKIGLVTAESGPISPWGNDLKKAIQLAANNFNTNYTIRGKKIELLIADSASRPEQGQSAAEKLIANGVIGLIGECSSGTTAQVAKVAFEKGVPLIAPVSTRKDLTEIGNNIFRVCYTDDYQGPTMAKFAFEELNLKKIAIFTDKNQPSSVDLSNSFKKSFKSKGGEIISEQFYSTGQTQFNAQLTNLKIKNPEGIFISGYYPEAGPIIRQANELGIEAYYLGGDGWDNNQILTSGGKAVYGSYFCSHFCITENNPLIQKFSFDWIKNYKVEPKSITTALGYDAAMLLFSALMKCKSLNSKCLADEISQVQKFPGITGEITFKGANGNPKKRILVISFTPNGRIIQKIYNYDNLMLL